MRRLLLPVLAVVLAVVLTGCSSSPAALTRSPEPSTPTSRVTVLDVSRSGGWCAEGACRHLRLVVRGDGWWWAVPADDDAAVDDLLVRDHHELSAAQRRALQDALRNTGLPGTQQAERSCASWVDGIDLTIRWRDGSGRQREASSCDYRFPVSDPLLAFADTLTSGA